MLLGQGSLSPWVTGITPKACPGKTPLVSPLGQARCRTGPFLINAMSPLAAHRDGEPGGAGPGGARIPHALPARVPRVPARPHVPVLAEGPGGETHLRVPAGFPGGLLHLDRAPVPAWREPIDTGLLLAPGHCCPHCGAPRVGLPTEGLCLWSSPGAGQGIISRCSQGSCWVPLWLIKTSGPCLTKRRCVLLARGACEHQHSQLRRASRACPAKRLESWETSSPHNSGVSQEELGDSITPPQTHSPSLLQPLSKSAQISLPLHPPHLPLGSSSPEGAGRDVLLQECHNSRLA